MNTREIIEKRIAELDRDFKSAHSVKDYYPRIAELKHILSSLPTQGKVKSAEQVMNESGLPVVDDLKEGYQYNGVIQLMEMYASQLPPNNEAMAPQSQGAVEVIQKRIEELRLYMREGSSFLTSDEITTMIKEGEHILSLLPTPNIKEENKEK